MTSARAAYRLLCETRPLLVLDTETCPADDGDHIVSIAAALWRGGRQRRLWTHNINPGVTITNSQHHGLTDDDVADAPTFAGIIDELEALLREPDVIVVCHNAPFDIGRLHLEYQRLGRGLPDVAVLDTMTLPRALDYELPTRSRTLASLCDHFGVRNAQPHVAASDVAATSEVLHALLNHAAATAVTSLTDVHAAAGATTTSRIACAAAERSTHRSAQNPIPAEHVAAHTALLPAEPTARALDTWVNEALDCARHRCPLLADKARTATAHAAELHPRLTKLLQTNAADLEPGQGATLVTALNILAPAGAATGKTTRPYRTWWRKHRALLHALERCSDTHQCPDCFDGDPCPLDVAHHPLVRAMCFDQPDGISGDRREKICKPSKTNTFVVRWTADGDHDIAGYAAWLVIDAYLREGNDARADACVEHAVSLGAHDPRIIRYYAERLTLHGRHSDAATLVRRSLKDRTTDSGWDELAIWFDRYRAHQRRRRRQHPARRGNSSPRTARPQERTVTHRFSM